MAQYTIGNINKSSVLTFQLCLPIFCIMLCIVLCCEGNIRNGNDTGHFLPGHL